MERAGRSRFKRHPWAWTFGGLAAVVVAFGVGFFVWLRSDPADPVEVGVVVDRYRAQSTAATTTDASSSSATTAVAPATTTAPRPGVYVYETTGSESVDALGGTRHRYPAETTITVTDGRADCIRLRWDALRQRWDDYVLCPRLAGWSIAERTTFHSFFRQDERREFTCDRDALFVPDVDADDGGSAGTVGGSRDRDVGRRARHRGSYRCESSGSGKSGASSEAVDMRVVGTEQLDVGGEPVDTVHVRYDVVIGGESEGEATVDRWFASDVPALLVREVREGWTKSETVIGDVNYDESYELRLQRIEPMG